MAQVIETALLAVALPRRVDERQVAGAAAAGVVRASLEEALLERHDDVLGDADADEARGGDGVAVADQRDRLGRRHDLAAFEGAQGVEQALRLRVTVYDPILQGRGYGSASTRSARAGGGGGSTRSSG